MKKLDKKVSEAVKFFWTTREKQKKKQASAGKADQGSRGEATGGNQLDGFVNLISELIVKCGVPEGCIYRKRNITLPGYFRPVKEWDLLVVVDGDLLASIELKSHIGPSFGNNFNNRAEEAIGSSQDMWTAYREGAFRESIRPWLGYFMLLEDCKNSNTPVNLRGTPHFPVFEEFKDASYAKRYEIFCRKLVLEGLYDAATLILSDKQGGLKGQYRESSQLIMFSNFVASLQGKALAYMKQKENQ